MHNTFVLIIKVFLRIIFTNKSFNRFSLRKPSKQNRFPPKPKHSINYELIMINFWVNSTAYYKNTRFIQKLIEAGFLLMNCFLIRKNQKLNRQIRENHFQKCTLSRQVKNLQLTFLNCYVERELLSSFYVVEFTRDSWS